MPTDRPDSDSGDGPGTVEACHVPGATSREGSRVAAMTDQVDRVLAAVQANGGRRTPATRAVVGVLAQSGSHPTVEDVVDDVRRQHPDVAESTIYRVLERLERLGLAEHVHIGHGPSVFHLIDARRHLHLLCDGCGQVIDVPDETVQALTDQLERAYDFELHLHHVALSGLCRQCRAGPTP
jgi:Fur family transcriptional regulator, ferric uptake regulator